MSPRILVDLSVAPPGGAATYVEGFVHGLVASRAATTYDVVVVVDATWASRHEDLVTALDGAGVGVVRHRFPVPGSWSARLTRGPRLAVLAKTTGADVAFLPRDVASSMPIPFVTLARNLHAWQTFGSRRSGRLGLWAHARRVQARRSTRKAAAVLAVSRPMAAVVDGPVAGIVHHGCSLPDHPRGASAARTGPIQVAMVANLIESKGVECVLSAVADAARGGLEVELKVYGRPLDDAYAAEIEQLSRELFGCSVLHGPRYGGDLVAAYHAADVLVVGSAFESFCHPLVEGMRSGCTVVAPRCDLVEEICGDVAVTYELGDVDDLARALVRAADELPERARSGVEWASAFRWEDTVEQTLDAVVRAATPRTVGALEREGSGTDLTADDGRERPRRVGVLWSRPSLYLSDCLEALARVADVRPFYSAEGLAGVDDATVRRFRGADCDAILGPQTDVLLVGGWRNVDYLRAAWRARRQGAATVLAFDTQLRNDVRMRLQLRLVGLVLTRLFTHAFVPGERQVVVARALGFPGGRVYTGLYACRQDPTAPGSSGDASTTGSVAPSFLWVGRLVLVKGVDVLAEAYRTYRAEVDDPWPFRVVGRGPLQYLLEGFELLGALSGEEVHAAMSEAAVLVSSSTYEPWGMVLAEGASHGLPVICTTAAGAGDNLVVDGRSGYVVASSDAEALAGAMVRMHRLPDEERRSMGVRSAELAAVFSPDAWARQVIEMHRASRRSRRRPDRRAVDGPPGTPGG